MYNKVELLRAIAIYNGRHRKYKYSIDEDHLVLNYYDKDLDNPVHVILKLKEYDTVDYLLYVLEDLRKDLTGKK